MPRPTELTPELAERIVSAVRAGAHPHRAVEPYIHRSTYWRWMKRGAAEQHRVDEGLEPDETEQRYATFRDDIERAEAESEITAVAELRKAIRSGGTKTKRKYDGNGNVTEEIVEELPGNAGLLLPFLKERWPERWKTPDRLDVRTNEDEMAAQFTQVVEDVLASIEDPEERAALRAKLAEGLRGGGGSDE